MYVTTFYYVEYEYYAVCTIQPHTTYIEMKSTYILFAYIHRYVAFVNKMHLYIHTCINERELSL